MKYPLSCLFALLIFFGCEKTEKENKPPRPNIIWFVAEDVSPRFAFYGDSLALTPALNSIANKGVVYENAFTVSGVCAPSRSSMITGCYPSAIGTQHMRQAKGVIPLPGVPNYTAVPPAEIKAFPELLRASGYWTASYRKLDYQFGAPFTIWDTVSENPHWRQRLEQDLDKPFFIYNTYEITHEINIWPDSTKEKFFNDLNIDRTKLAGDVVQRPPLDSMGHKIALSDVKVPPYFPDTELARDHIARLYYNIMRMDQQIAKVLADLKADGLEETTILFFMSDHGDCLPRGKRWLYESGTKSPLVIYIPDQYLPEGFKKQGRDNNLYSYIDLPPTVLEIAGVKIPDWIHGKSIISTLSKEPREYIHGSRDRMDNRYDVRRSIRNKQYRYIKNFEPKKPYQQQIAFLERMPLMRQILDMNEAGELNETQSAWLASSKPAEELYDLDSDPYEINNLAENANYSEIKAELEKDLMQWMMDINDMHQISEADQAEAAWPGGVQPETLPVTFVEKDGVMNLSCNTKGSTIAYRIVGSERWEIFTEPFKYDGQAVESQAIRYGYKTSEKTTYNN